MRDQRTHAPAEAVEQAIVVMSLTADPRRPWSHDEILDEIGNRTAATRALASLKDAGMIRRRGKRVLPTRIAGRLDRIER